MTVRNFLTVAVVINLVYGLAFFLAPQGSAEVYGYGAMTTPLTNLLVQFFGITFIAAAMMCLVARSADKSTGRTAVVYFIAVSELLFLYMDIRTMIAGRLPG